MSNVDPTLFPDYRTVRKRDLREQLSIIKQEIEALQNAEANNGLVLNAVGDALADTAALNDGMIQAAEEGRPFVPQGTFLLTPEETSTWQRAKQFDVHYCCYLKSGLRVDARNAIFMMDTRRWTLIPTLHRILMFGTPHTTVAGTYSDIYWLGGVFDFTETYGTGFGSVFGFGPISVDNMHVQDTTFYYPTATSATNARGRGFYAANCRNRTSDGLKFINSVQGYVTVFDDDFRDTNFYATGYTEFYDADEGAHTGIIENGILKAPVTDDDAFDFASVTNVELNNIHVDEGYACIAIYDKEQLNWQTYDEFYNLAGNANATPGASNDNNPIVTMDGSANWTWEDDGYDYKLEEAGRVSLTVEGGVLPTGFAAATLYYIVGASVSGRSAQLSATSGGAAIPFTDAGSGTFRAIRYPTPDEASTGKNITVNNFKGTNLKVSTSPTVMVAAYQDQLGRTGIDRQAKNIAFNGIYLDGGTGFCVNEGSVRIKGLKLENTQSYIGTGTADPQHRGALCLRQIVGANGQTANSYLDVVGEDIEINNAYGAAIVIDNPRNVHLERVKINEYATREDATDIYRGISITRMGAKTGHIHIGDVEIVTTIENCTDIYLSENASAVPYIFTQGLWRLKTVSAGSVRTATVNFFPISIPIVEVHVPTYTAAVQTSGARGNVWADYSRYLHVFATAFYSNTAQTASANYSAIRLLKSNAGVAGVITGSTININQATIAADVTSRAEVDTSDADSLIVPATTALRYEVIIPGAGGTGSDPSIAGILKVSGLTYITT